MTLKAGDYVQRIPNKQKDRWKKVMRQHSLHPNGVYRVESIGRGYVVFLESINGIWDSKCFKKVEDVSNLTIEDFM